MRRNLLGLENADRAGSGFHGQDYVAGFNALKSTQIMP